MKNEKKSLTDLTKIVHDVAVEHGWWEKDKERSVGDLLLLIVSEATEAFEEYRKGKGFNETYYSDSSDGHPKMEGIPSELADIIIRVLDMCGAYGIDIEAAVKEKIEYNKTRPYRHGNKKC